MRQYAITETQINAIRDRLTPIVGSAMAQHIADTHPRVVSNEHVASTGESCEVYIVRFPMAGDYILVVWMNASGMNLPDGTGQGEFLCGLYRNEICSDALAVYDGNPAIYSPF